MAQSRALSAVLLVLLAVLPLVRVLQRWAKLASVVSANSTRVSSKKASIPLSQVALLFRLALQSAASKTNTLNKHWHVRLVVRSRRTLLVALLNELSAGARAVFVRLP